MWYRRRHFAPAKPALSIWFHIAAIFLTATRIFSLSAYTKSTSHSQKTNSCPTKKIFSALTPAKSAHWHQHQERSPPEKRLRGKETGKANQKRLPPWTPNPDKKENPYGRNYRRRNRA
jgi:hypothetical protein